MQSIELRKELFPKFSSAAWERALPWIFAVTIGLSAFLLFAVQPLFARMVLPKLGGSPSVWAVAMCFFQTVLLGGYCYAHLLNSRLTPSRAVIVHIAVLATACLALPIALPVAASAPTDGNAYLWLIGILAVGVGLPFFAVSANAPLLQSWFGRTGHAHAADPYFLYGASNFGSLAALLLYPVLIEPLAGLSMQSVLWTMGFMSLALTILGCAFIMLGRSQSRTNTQRPLPATMLRAPTLEMRLFWIALSFVPSGLLVAFTTYLTTDIASAPFLWVLPLALFLATFIVVFRDRPLLSMHMLTLLLPFAAAATYICMIAMAIVPFWVAGLVGLTTFLIISLVCHRTLYENRPSGQHLTEFYLWMSFGGVLGGIFAALAAPHLFTTIFEFPILILAGVFMQPKLMSASLWKVHGRHFAAIAGCGVATLLALDKAGATGWLPVGRKEGLIIALLCLAIAIVWRRRPVHQAACICLILVTTIIPGDTTGARSSVRSFFGVLRVQETEAGDVRFLVHGTTNHGAQRIKDANGRAIELPVPASYYHPKGPMARGLALFDGPRSVGIVGLGAGAMACYARSIDNWRLFEIDPAVIQIARDPKKFTFLSRCLPQAPIIVGDARLKLAGELPHAYDYLLIDAFSSDSIPVHLMTVEALKLYMEKVKSSGLLAMHISNRNLDLSPVIAATLAELPGVHGALVRNEQLNSGFDASSSIVVVLTRDAKLLERVLAWPDARPLTSNGVAAWTDDYADLLSAMWRGWKKP